MKLTEKLLLFIVVPIFIVLAIILSPLLILGYIINLINTGKYKKHYPIFLNSIEGRKFLLHTDRQKTKEYIQFTLQPLLSPDIEITTINGEIFTLEINKWCFSKMIKSISPITYPVVIKIVDGKILSFQINNQFYNAFHQNKDITVLAEKINNF
jgi:hypothetical protein